MKITKIYVNPLPQRLERLCGTASIVLDGAMAINDIKILYSEKNDRGYFIEFPNNDKTKKAGREIIAPLNRKTRDYIETEVLKEYFIKDKIENNRLFGE